MPSAPFPYEWTLANATFPKDKGTVFSCFACGGGSTMGYKLAGFDVLGCNEIDPRMMAAYVQNHHPRFSFLEPIQTFAQRKDLPPELYNLDILDGSPPCSSFSMAGNREADWGKEKVFREGQSLQVLDTLFFDFIDLAKELQPKMVIAENVKGLLMGNAIHYVRRIYKEFDAAGYELQHWLLDASVMGVPQRRERVFFIALRKDLAGPFMRSVNLFEQKPYLDMAFDYDPIPFGQFATYDGAPITSELVLKAWPHRQPDDGNVMVTKSRIPDMKASDFSTAYVHEYKVCSTVLTQGTGKLICYDKPIHLSKRELSLIGTFPLDYNYEGTNHNYIIRMSVPPVMTAQVATRVHAQWLAHINKAAPIARPEPAQPAAAVQTVQPGGALSLFD